MPALDAWTPDGWAPSPWMEACRERDDLRALLREARDVVRAIERHYRTDASDALVRRIRAALEKP
jgi:hypothetical protein